MSNDFFATYSNRFVNTLSKNPFTIRKDYMNKKYKIKNAKGKYINFIYGLHIFLKYIYILL